ncbi:hypothetical protein GE09DRAFT_138538 [Coniochaeta sp. 2T2.1]|nr:hypothetical protein GE09DRAFT_138538 [Coniochaeta sp. 2T2.1]
MSDALSTFVLAIVIRASIVDLDEQRVQGVQDNVSHLPESVDCLKMSFSMTSYIRQGRRTCCLIGRHRPDVSSSGK